MERQELNYGLIKLLTKEKKHVNSASQEHFSDVPCNVNKNGHLKTKLIIGASAPFKKNNYFSFKIVVSCSIIKDHSINYM